MDSYIYIRMSGGEGKKLKGGENMKKTERIAFVITEEKKKEVEKLAEEKGLSVAGLMNLAISELLKNNK